MKFSTFSTYLKKLEETPLRNKMTEILAELFQKCSSEEIDKICYLSLGRLAPKYEGIEFNMGEKLMVRAVAISVGKTAAEATKVYKRTGDLGNIVEKLRNYAPHKCGAEIEKLGIIEVYEKLRMVAEDNGEGSVERKINNMAKLLKELGPLSAKYIARIPINKLRLGFSDMTILDALSWMKTGDKSLRPELERAFNVLADIGKIASIFKNKGLRGIKRIRSEVGVPIRAALAERLKDPKKILEKMGGKCVLEGKYDGMRCQLHIDKTRELLIKKTNLNLFKDKKQSFVRIFSRNLDNTTHMFPDIVEAVQKLKVKSAILDGEAIAFNPRTGKFLSFQETVQRKRKHGVGEKVKEIPLKVFVFDLLYLNGKTLLDRPFIERRRELERLLDKTYRTNRSDRTILLTKQKIVQKPKEFDQFFNQVVSEELEGLMAKKLDAVYQAGARNFNWVKYKAGMKSELADTIDCVVMGYYFGKGKRSAFGIGAFLVGILDEQYNRKQKAENGERRFLTVSKIGTGLTDEQWKRMFKSLKSLKVPSKGGSSSGRQSKPKGYIVDKNLYPDVWCRPSLVVEIEADTITKSPIHTAGLALRFPRLKRFRDDKPVSQSTSLSELKKLAK